MIKKFYTQPNIVVAYIMLGSMILSGSVSSNDTDFDIYDIESGQW